MANQTITIRLSAITQKFRNDLKKAEKAVEDLDDAAKDVDGRKFRREMDKNSKKTEENDSALLRLIKNLIKFKVLLTGLKFGALLTGLRLALPLASALGAALFAIASSAGIFAGAIALYPAAAAGMLSAFGALKYATSGVGEALSVLLADEASLEEYTKALNSVSPAVAEVARHLHSLKDVTDASRKRAQENLFAGLARGLSALRKGDLLATVTDHMERMAGVLGDLAEGFLQMFGSDSVVRDLATVFDGNERSTRSFGRVLTNLTEALIAVVAAAQPVVNYMLDQWARKTDGLAASIDRAGLTDYFWSVYYAARRLGAFLGDLYGAFKNISDVLTNTGLRDRFLDPIEDSVRTFREFTASAAGVQAVTDWFRRGADVMDSFYRLLGSITGALRKMDPQGAQVLVNLFDTMSAEGGQIERLFAAMGKMDLQVLVDTLLKFVDLLIEVMDLFGTLENVVIIVGYIADGFMMVAKAFGILPDSVLNVIGGLLAMNFVVKTLTMKSFNLFTLFTRGPGAAVSAFETLRLRGMFAMDAIRKGLGVVGGKALSVAKAFKSGFTSVLSVLGKVAGFLGKTLLGAAKLLGRGFTLVLRGIGTALGLVGKAIMAVGHVIRLAFATNPVGLIILAIIAVIALFVVLWKKSETFRRIVTGAWEAVKKAAMATWEWLKTNWSKLLILLGPFGVMLKVFIDNFAAIKDGAKRAMDAVVSAFRRALDTITNLPGATMILNVAGKAVGIDGLGDSLKGYAKSRNKGKAVNATSHRRGDRSPQRPRASGGTGNLSQTLRAHAAVEAMTPGKRRISNATKGRWAGSDHHKGKALDLVGPFMGAYKKNLAAMGGMAETHGQGSGSHLHAVYPSSGGGGGGFQTQSVSAGGPSGDTMRPRSPAGGGAPARSIVIEGPLIGQVVANREMDVHRAVYGALRDFVEERSERR